jgi:hypothetical protein
MTATRKRPEVNKPGNRQEMTDPADSTREVHRGNNNDKNSFKGNLVELSNNVYQYGTCDQGDRFTRMAEAIADYAGKEYSRNEIIGEEPRGK